MAEIKALLFDIGEVVTTDQWPLLDHVEQRTGRKLVGRGPLDPPGDPLWQRYLAGDLSYTDYWVEYAELSGFDDWRALYRQLIFDPPDSFVHPEADRLIREAQAAGLLVGALTNDGVSISGREWFDTIPLIASFDAFADAQAFGGKPAPEAYLNAADQLGVAPEEIVFLDDMTYCVDGARAVGMWAVLIDPMDRRTGFDEARRLAGLYDSHAERLVTEAEAAYLAGDLDRIMSMFDPDISIHWNGERVALGIAEARQFHVDRLGIGAADTSIATLRKRLRSASGDTIAVEYEATTRRSDGTTSAVRAAEIWTLRRGKLIEWHCYAAPSTRDAG